MSSYRIRVCSIFPWLMERANNFLRNEQDRYDLAMDTVEALLMNEERYDGRPMEPWAYVIMQNKFRNTWAHNHFLNMVSVDDCEVEGGTEDHDAKVLLRIVIDIAKEDRNVAAAVMLAEGHHVKELSEREGCTEAALKMRIQRGRARLRSMA